MNDSGSVVRKVSIVNSLSLVSYVGLNGPSYYELYADISKIYKISFIFSANSLSTTPFTATTPPNALTGSHFKAST